MSIVRCVAKTSVFRIYTILLYENATTTDDLFGLSRSPHAYLRPGRLFEEDLNSRGEDERNHFFNQQIDEKRRKRDDS